MSRFFYRRLDYAMGWLLMLVASTVYLLTMEPTTSFWDCGEFIASGHKLIIGHPPGAPFFMLLMRMFTMWAPTPEMVGFFGNLLSVFASGATVMFLYWTIAYFARRLYLDRRGAADGVSRAQIEDKPLDPWAAALIISASAIGALCYTFTDTFWFSAVEGEVYALSSLFTAVVFWAILKWESVAHDPQGDRWIVLIALLMGLSIGVHLLNLLAIPAIGLVYYYRNYEVTGWGIVKCLVISGVILLLVLYGIIQGLVVIASRFELLFVNTFGLPFQSGAITFFILLIAAVLFGVWYTQRKALRVANLAILCVAMLLLGYGSYATIYIRSLANPTMDQNGVDNMFALKSYLNREQYGDRPLITGPYFNAPIEEYGDGSPTYAPRGDRYEIVNRKPDITYDARFTTLFPRMWSSDPIHVQGYKQWVDIKGTPIQTVDRQGKAQRLIKPTFFENIQFFLRYQVGFMYWRYFMWNFSGRQNDLQGYGGDAMRGNWITGIAFLDRVRLGDQSQLPEAFRNHAHNRYYMLPLLLGIAGLFYQWRRHPKDASVVLTLFIMTGIAIVVYLNQKPYEPRERDYTFAGSFYAFAIWVGLGVIPCCRLLAQVLRKAGGVIAGSILCLLGVPVLMATENWDDHDRSGRYIALDFARNMMTGVEQNGILFTYADNDTFPLWYVAECEEFRPDVRICNLTYLGGDWYIDVMNRKAYQGDRLPFGMERESYLEGKNDVVLVTDRLGRSMLLRDAMRFVLSDDPRTKVRSPFVGAGSDGQLSYLPTRDLLVPTNPQLAQRLRQGQFAPHTLDTIHLSPSGNYLYKNGFAVYALMANNDWQRPLYYSPMLPKDMYWGLDRYFVRSGLSHQVLPVGEREDKTSSKSGDAPESEGSVQDIRGPFGTGSSASSHPFVAVDTARMAKLLLEEYSFRGLNDPDILMDETCKRMIEYYLSAFAEAIEANLRLGANSRAVEFTDFCFENLPPQRVGWSYRWLDIIDGYYRAGANEKGSEVLRQYADHCLDIIDFSLTLPISRAQADNDVRMAHSVIQGLMQMAQMRGDSESLQYINTCLGQL